MIKDIKCPICGKKSSETFWAMHGYKLARCKACGMVWDFMPHEHLLSLYDKTYFMNENPKGGYANYFEGMRINKKTFSQRLKRIEKKHGKGRLLDVGCALGDCLMEAKKLGWKDALGIEVSDYAYKFARKRGLNVKKGNLKKNSISSNSFDVITYQDVIEHIADPVDELKRIYKVLKPGGLVFLVTPDVGGWWNKILGPLWYHYKPDEHVMYFSQESLKKALKIAGFKNIKTRKTYHVLSVEYVINRLRYYSPFIFENILKIIRKLRLKDMSFRAYTGEIEAWGTKPK
ncbi:MAG: class I SAM-dependent methyltransferase [Patescibacteria group bacterium]|jgi:2-polyprenyl-3-methyl-5-hydroxy-6-metoxy-1,4-benzoquinol methylase